MRVPLIAEIGLLTWLTVTRLQTCDSTLLRGIFARHATLGHDPEVDSLSIGEPDTSRQEDDGDEGAGSEDAAENLCMEGHLVPEFFLLGAQKAATSTFSKTFTTDGIVRGNWSLKFEVHFFHGPHFWPNGKDWWLSHYPACTKDSRQVACDETPNHLAFVHEVVPRLNEIYGTLVARLKFAVILREPVTRAHSAFHFFQNGRKLFPDRTNCAMTYLDENENSSGFNRYAQDVLAGNDPCHYFRDGNYSNYLERYFSPASGLETSQFTIFTFKQVIAPEGGRSSAVRHMWEKLGVVGDAPEVAADNMPSHLLIEDEMDGVSLARLREYVDSTMGALQVASVFLKYGVRPFDFNEPLELSSLSEWLKSSW